MQEKAPLTQDHVISCDNGAPNAMHNVVWACQRCNSSRGSKDLIAWWDETYGRGIKGMGTRGCLPRLPAGIYLKLAYDWHKVNHSLDYPARELSDLKPFQNCQAVNKELSPASQIPSQKLPQCAS